jgi:hypothetical protein
MIRYIGIDFGDADVEGLSRWAVAGIQIMRLSMSDRHFTASLSSRGAHMFYRTFRVGITYFFACVIATTTLSAQSTGLTADVSFPAPVVSGSEAVVRVTVRNQTQAPITNYSAWIGAATDLLMLGGSGDGWNCATSNSRSLRCTRPVLPVGESTFEARFIGPNTPGTAFLNVDLHSTYSPGGMTGEWVSYPVTAAALEARLSVEVPEREASDGTNPAELSLRVTNHGPDHVPGVVAIQSIVISGWWGVATSLTPEGWSCSVIGNNSEIECRSGALAPGESRLLTLRPDRSGAEIVRTARVHALGVSDPHLSFEVINERIERGETEQFRRVLFPIYIRPAEGAFGSRWTSELSIFADAEAPVEFFPFVFQCGVCTCPPPPTLQPMQNRVLHQNPYLLPLQPTTNPGLFLYVSSSDAPHMSYQLRSRDVSREQQTWGTEIPVVREEEFRRHRVNLLDVPMRSGFRHTLRIYSHDGTPGTARVRLFDAAGDQIAEHEVFLRPGSLPYHWRGYFELPTDPAYGQLDMGEILTPGSGSARGRIVIEPAGEARIWAMLSVTHNETQHVTIISPQNH